jgi:hypothetical protein
MSLSYRHPIDAPLGSPFHDPKRAALHLGQDYPAWTGQPVKPMAPGRVRTVAQHRLYGFHVEIVHADGRLTTYNQLQAGGRPAVGDEVGYDTVIGYVGHPLNDLAEQDRAANPLWSGCAKVDALGNRVSSGSHLHAGATEPNGGVWTDPVALIDSTQPAGGSGTPIEEDTMNAAQTFRAVWHHDTFKDGLTPGQSLVQIRESTVRLELGQAMLLQRGNGQFFKHGGMASKNPLWIWVTESGDFIRIRDKATALLYKERNGGVKALEISAAAIRMLVADLTEAGGRDLSATVGSTATTVTTAGQRQADDAGLDAAQAAAAN